MVMSLAEQLGIGGANVGIGLEEIWERARQIKLVLTDCDGVLTDGGVYYSPNGEELKRFSVRDGMGVERLREKGIQTAIITRESSPSVRSEPRSSSSDTCTLAFMTSASIWAACSAKPA